MRWIPDNSGLFPQRPCFDSMSELDEECQRMVVVTYYRRRHMEFAPPLDDDTLQVLIEDDADVDLYCEMPPGVDGYTEFRPGMRPVIRINRLLSETPTRRHRLRTTLAHEWFHARYHGTALEKLWAERRVHSSNAEDLRGKCLHDEIICASESNWFEFQAGYASCALLMPKTWVEADLIELQKAGSTSFDSTIQFIATKYQVSVPAAKWRLQWLGFRPQLQLLL